MIQSLNIAPVKFSNVSVLSQLAVQLKLKFSLQINIIELNLELDKSFSPERAQYYSSKIIADAENLTSSYEGKIIILTEVDLHIPVLTFVFGEAQLNGKHSVVSVCRLHEEFYSGHSDDGLLLKRSLKEILHELGHCFGLRHCENWDCVMHSSPGIEEVDIKGEGYCHKCIKSVQGYKQIFL